MITTSARIRDLAFTSLLAISLCLGLQKSVHSQVVITEVMYDATYDDIWEWIEITNTGESAVNMDGYFAFNLTDPDIPDTANGGLGPSPSILSSLDPDTTIEAGETMIIYDGFYAVGNPNNFMTDQQFRDSWGIAGSVKVLGAQFWPTLTNTPGNQQQSIGFWPTKEAWRADMTPAGGGDGATTTSFANTAFSLDFSMFPVTSTVDGQSSITWTGNGSNQDGANWVQSINGINSAVTSVQTSIGTGSDVGNPGIVSSFGPGAPAAGIYFTEIMYDPSTDSSAPLGEWVEVYNNSGADIDLTGWILDDGNNTPSVSGPEGNIAGGTIPQGGTGILFNATVQTGEEFGAAWGPGLNLIPVTNWTTSTMALNNGGDTVALWDSFADYSGDHATHTNAVANQAWSETDEVNPFPAASNASLTLGSLDATNFPRETGTSWLVSSLGDDIGSFVNGLRHPGGDVGSPGSFTVVEGTPGDFDGDGDVDGIDFLEWQRGNSPNNGSAADLLEWQNNYPTGAVAAATSVPEPGSLVLLGLAFLPLAIRRK